MLESLGWHSDKESVKENTEPINYIGRRQMSNSNYEQIKADMGKKTSDELIEIVETDNYYEWTEEGLQAAHEILVERGVVSPKFRSAMTVGQALFSFQGRMCRGDYWLKGFLVLLPFGIINNLLYYGTNIYVLHMMSMIISIASFWPGLALLVKRLHDRNRSGWFAAMIFIPLVQIWILIEVWFLRGTVGSNRFGDDPLQESA